MTGPIVLSGSLTMVSANGDGEAMLIEAAEFVSGFAALGVVIAVEIRLRPAAEESAPEPSLVWIAHPAPMWSSAPGTLTTGDTLTPGDEEWIETPPGMVVDPLTAAAQGEASSARSRKESPARKRGGSTSWRVLSTMEQRRAAVDVLAALWEKHGRAPTQREYEEAKPEWMPGAGTLMTGTFKEPWAEIVRTSRPLPDPQ
ncbi:MAG: hypothetical protein NAOJABEB_03287 [Steroidobacteraceae bacterium]|nr:hypothetical protein [Steroidobacteraceae bacterium]